MKTSTLERKNAKTIAVTIIGVVYLRLNISIAPAQNCFQTKYGHPPVRTAEINNKLEELTNLNSPYQLMLSNLACPMQVQCIFR